MTVNLEAKVLADKAIRDAHKATLDNHLSDLKLGLEERGLVTRAVNEVAERAKATLSEATEIAQEHPGVIAGTIATLALWILRNPIIRWLDDHPGHRK